jgi:disulfide oxidoreductase YuzD
MDPITTAIVAVLPALASDLVKTSVKDAYEGLKALIRRKWGDAGPVAKAVDALEADPGSEGQAAVLAEKVKAAKATEDPDVMTALAALVNELKQAKIGGKAVSDINVSISGGAIQGVVGAKKVSVDTMIFGTPPKNRSSSEEEHSLPRKP